MPAVLTGFDRVLARLSGRNRLAPTLFIAYLFLGALWLALAPPSLRSDTDTDHAPQAANLLAGNGFVYPNGKTAHRYPPLHPLWLGAQWELADQLGIRRMTVTATVSVILTSLCALTLFRLARLVFDDRHAVVASFLYLTHPFIVMTVLQPWSETPFMLLFYLGLFRSMSLLEARDLRWQAFLGAGALFGLAMLTRSIALLLPVVVAGFLAFGFKSLARWPRRALLAGAIIGGAALAILPWEYFLVRRQEGVILLSSGDVPSLRDGLSFNHKDYREKMELAPDVQRLTDRVWSVYRTLKTKTDVARFLLRELEANPVTVLRLYGLKLARSWYGTDSQRQRFEKVNIALAVFYGAPSLVGLAFALRLRGREGQRRLAAVVVGLAAYFWLMTTAVLSIVRYMVPMIGVLLVFMPWGMSRVFRAYGKTRRRHRGGAAEQAA